jgi:hypothetical protein
MGAADEAHSWWACWGVVGLEVRLILTFKSGEDCQPHPT